MHLKRELAWFLHVRWQEVFTMFESLDETMKHDEQRESTPRERITKYIVTALVSLVVVGGLLISIRMLE